MTTGNPAMSISLTAVMAEERLDALIFPQMRSELTALHGRETIESLTNSHAPSTVRRRLSAIGKMHRLNDLPWNTAHRDIQEPLQGLALSHARQTDRSLDGHAAVPAEEPTRVGEKYTLQPDGCPLDQLLPEWAGGGAIEMETVLKRRSAWTSTFVAGLELAKQGRSGQRVGVPAQHVLTSEQGPCRQRQQARD